jgi:hypothetical protein
MSIEPFPRDAVVITDQPGPTEIIHGREACELFTREMLLTADPEMAIVRIFGSDKSGNAVRVGFTPERAIRIGAAFIRAGLGIKPSLRLQVLEDAVGKPGEADLKLVAEKQP